MGSITLDAPATMKEAKKRWKHTKTLLTKDARADFKHGEHWTTIHGYPVVVSNVGEWYFVFHKREGRYVSAYWYDPRSHEISVFPRGVKEWRPL